MTTKFKMYSQIRSSIKLIKEKFNNFKYIRCDISIHIHILKISGILTLLLLLLLGNNGEK